MYLDSEDGHPSWVSVKTGLFGISETLVPIDDATWDESALHVTFSKDRIREAPRVDPDQDLSPDEQDRLYSYYEQDAGATGSVGSNGYGEQTVTDAGSSDDVATGYTGVEDPLTGQAVLGLPDAESTAPAARDEGTAVQDAQLVDGRTERGPVGTGADGAVADDDAMTRSEERLKVGTRTVQTGRARLRKYIVTEQQHLTVPVTHEEVHVEREPITEADLGDSERGVELSEEQAEIVLHEERIVIEKETVPVERVRLEKDVVTEDREVTEDVRSERIEVEGDVADDVTEPTAGR